MSSEFEELESLLFDWEAGTLNHDGVDRIRDILNQNEAARTFFLQQQVMSAALKREGDSGLGLPSAENSTNDAVHPTEPVRRSTGGPLRFNYWIAMVAMLLIVLVGRLVQLELSSNSNQSGDVTRAFDSKSQRKEATSHGVAIVTRLVDITWDEGQTALDVGDALSPGRLAIKSGFAQVEFFGGATLIIEGPADLDIQSEMLARVRSGRLRAQVPPAARGFSLEVDDMKVVDLGTEFGLSVSAEGANVQVFDGEIELYPAEKKKQPLKAGQALVRTADGVFKKSEVTPEQYLDIATMESRDQGQHRANCEKWEAWTKKLRHDPRLITYYAFDQKGPWSRRLKCDLLPKNSELDGAIVGAKSVPGRWKEKRALEFKRPGDRVRVYIPGEYSSLSFACWVKIDSLDRMFNSLFLTDSYNLGEPHWQILDTGQMYFSVRPEKKGFDGILDRKVLSPPFWKPSLSGKWLHLATTYDTKTGQAAHYLNGKEIHSELIPEAQLVKTTRIGTATIGNWSESTIPDAHFAIRNLNGCIDELAIFSEALTSDEIMEMYENGKP